MQSCFLFPICANFLCSLVAEEVIKHAIVPPFSSFGRHEFLPIIRNELEQLRHTIAEVLREKGLLPILPGNPNEVYGGLARIIQDAMGENPELNDAKAAFFEGDFDRSTNLLRNLSISRPKYKSQLFTALVCSHQHHHWREAEHMLETLPELGRPRGFRALAYNYWINNDIGKAISFAEISYEREQQASRDNNGVMFGRNSVAYYYADGELTERSDLALEYASAEVEARSARKDESHEQQLSYAKALATRGYVNITFGKSRKEIESGLVDCENARRLGAREDLYFRHLARAQDRLRALT